MFIMLFTVVIDWKSKKEEEKKESQGHLCTLFGAPLKKLCLLREYVF